MAMTAASIADARVRWRKSNRRSGHGVVNWDAHAGIAASVADAR
jgi:hypothetical protein